MKLLQAHVNDTLVCFRLLGPKPDPRDRGAEPGPGLEPPRGAARRDPGARGDPDGYLASPPDEVRTRATRGGAR